MFDELFLAIYEGGFGNCENFGNAHVDKENKEENVFMRLVDAFRNAVSRRCLLQLFSDNGD